MHNKVRSCQNRLSHTTSREEGAFPPAPPPLTSSKESAKARCAAHERMLDQRRNQATSTLACKMLGTSRAFATATARKKCAVSGDQRPPTSPARMTNRARPPAPANSGQVLSFRRCADLMATPSRLAAPSLAVPSRRKAQELCQWPTGPHQTVTAHLPRPPDDGHRAD